jgi:hypothetical protein
MLLLRKISVVFNLWWICMGAASAASYAQEGRIFPVPDGYSLFVTFAWPTPEYPDIPLRCNYNDECWLGPSVTMAIPGWNRTYNPEASKLAVRYRNGEMLSSVRTRWVSKYGTTGTMQEGYWAAGNVEPYLSTALACFQYWPDFGVGGQRYTQGVNLPDTVCSAPTPPDVTCDSIPSMVYDFGTVAAGRTDSLQMRQRHNLSCTNATSVTLKLQSALVLTRSLTANMTVNGRALGPAGVTLAANGNSVPLDFVVTTTGTENTGGSYNASSVLIMGYN